MKQILFIYASSRNYSGGQKATELIINGLKKRNWDCIELKLPVFYRSLNYYAAISHYASEFLLFIVGFIKSFLITRPIIYVNIGQSKFALLRDGIPFLLLSLLHHSRKSIISLHGSWFMNWKKGSLVVKWFNLLCLMARYITVLGPNQKIQLQALGIPIDKVIIIDNTCDMEGISGDQFESKIRRNGKVSLLFLSNLVDTKGFSEFLEALYLYSQKHNNPEIRATLCGNILITGYSDRFRDVLSARAYIEKIISMIRERGLVDIQWIPGTDGKVKEYLFRDSDIFVFPSRIEAQPICLLEALANGCAIVTTRVGEIPYTVEDNAAILISAPTPEVVLSAIEKLIQNPSLRKSLATNGYNLFRRRYTFDEHINKWETLLNN